MYNKMAGFDAGNALAGLTSAVALEGPWHCSTILSQISKLRRATFTTSAEPPSTLHLHAATEEQCSHSHTLNIVVERECQAMVTGRLRG
jgi:hypothetical protein